MVLTQTSETSVSVIAKNTHFPLYNLMKEGTVLHIKNILLYWELFFLVIQKIQ